MIESRQLVVQGRSLCKQFSATGRHLGAIQALDQVSLDVKAGSITALVGPDGAGKTTLIRLMTGLLRSDSGSLHILGFNTATQAQAIQDKLGYMPQRFGLYEDLSVQENLDLYADLHGVSLELRNQRYIELMQMTDLGRFKNRLAGKLSGGMKQKLGLACTLIRLPELLLLDEPTVGVDPLSRRDLWQIIIALQAQSGLSVVVSTAYLDEAEHCDQIVLLHQGRVLAQGQAQDISAYASNQSYLVSPPVGVTARRVQAQLWRDSATLDAVPQAGRVRWVRHAAAPALLNLQNALWAGAAQPVPASLEDGFMALLRQQAQFFTNQPNGGKESNKTLPHNHLDTSALDSSPYPPVVGHTEVVIEAHDLVRRFGDFLAVDCTSFEVRRGEIFGLLGPNGAGKTTTFRMLCGLLAASSGRLRVMGVDLRHARAQARQHIGYVAQKFALYGQLTVLENLQFFAGAYGLYGTLRHQSIARICQAFGLNEVLQMPAAALPGGFKQRLSMAAALMHQPDILFLDEPTSGADPLARRDFWQRISALSEQGVTVIITTHFMEEAEYCDRILIQDSGRMLALGTPLQVRQQAAEGLNFEPPSRCTNVFSGALINAAMLHNSAPYFASLPSECNMNMEQAFIAIVEQGRAHQTKASV